MPRYTTRAPQTRDRVWTEEERLTPPLPHPSVFVGEPVNTGLLDKDGRRLCRLPDCIGFLVPVAMRGEQD